jgi:hypothetical protein
MRGALVFGVTAVALIVLVVNLILLGHATTSNDPVGRLTPSSMLVRVPAPNHAQPSPRRELELPDD